MKNKKSIYLLLPLTLLIWGIIGYRIYQSIKPEDSYAQATSFPTFTALTNDQTPDTFTLINNYRDPFLSAAPPPVTKPVAQVHRPASKPQIIKKVEKPKPPKKQPKVRWPKIAYKGSFKNKGSSRQLALVNINQTEHFLGINDTASKVRLLNIWRDSIKVKCQHEYKTIHSQ